MKYFLLLVIIQINDIKSDAISPQDAVVIECSETSMSMTILNSAYHNITFALQNTSCIFTNNGTHSTITIDFDECGTTLTQTSDYLVYSNRAETSKDPGAIITRDPFHYVTIECKFNRTALLTTNEFNFKMNITDKKFEKINITKGVTTSNFAALDLKLFPTAEFNGSAYTQDDYPLPIKVRENINVGINIATENPNIKIIPQNCFATPTSSLTDATKHYFLQSRCTVDPSYKVVALTPKSFKFNFKAFKFFTSTSVFVHCQLAVCVNQSTLALCSLNCDNQARKRRETSDQSDIDDDRMVKESGVNKYTLSSPQIILIDADEEGANDSKHSSNKTIMVTSLAIGLVLLLSLIFAMVLICRWRIATKRNYKMEEDKEDVIA